MVYQKISSLQFISVMTLFLFGSSSVLGLNFEAEQDSWIAFIIALILSMFVALLYGRIATLQKSKNIFNICTTLFGNKIGKIFCAIFFWYALHLGALVLFDFTAFIEVSILTETPIIPIILLILIASIYLAKSGVEALGKWSTIILPYIILIVIASAISGADIIDFDNIKPVLEHEAKVLLPISYKIVAFPFAESVLFLSIIDFANKKSSAYKLFIFSFLISGALLLIVVLRNTLTLGADLSKHLYFPSYVTARLINIGDFLTRIEAIITANLFLAGIAKICICVVAASRGMVKILNLKDYKELIIPVSMLMFAICLHDNMNIMQLYFFTQIYHIYAFPFQILLPVIIWITAEIKARKSNSKPGKAKVSPQKRKIPNKNIGTNTC